MAGRRERSPAYLRPEDLYRWPDEVQARLGVGRSVYDLIAYGGLRVLHLGRRTQVLGRDVIAAIVRVDELQQLQQEIRAAPLQDSTGRAAPLKRAGATTVNRSSELLPPGLFYF